MENASKALLMAAGVLVGILILTLAVYLFTTFGATSAELHDLNQQSQIDKFNIQFTQYEGKSDVTIYDVITVANLASDNNKYYGLVNPDENNYYIRLHLERKKGSDRYYLERASQESLNELLQEEMLIANTDDSKNTILGDSYADSQNRLPTYKCVTTINPVTRRVNIVNFIEK